MVWAGSSDESLTPAQIESLRAWSLKTYLVLSVVVGEISRFAEHPETPGVIPDFTGARQLNEKDTRVFEGMAFNCTSTPNPNAAV